MVVFHPQLNLYSAYAHLETAAVSENEEVTRGQSLGTIGLFEESGGMVHLHWEVCRAACNGELDRTIDPQPDALPCFDSAKAMPSRTFSVPMRCCRD